MMEQRVDELSPVAWYRAPMLWVRRLYDWTLHWAASRYSVAALFFIAMIEASLFPIPPDVLLGAMALSRPRRSFYYAAVCTVGSVLGGVVGFAIGWGLWASFGKAAECPQFGGGGWLFETIPGFGCAAFARVQELYRANAWMALFVAAFTPIPYKVFTIASGVFHVPLWTVISASIVGRGARFFLVGALVFSFGHRIRRFMEQRFEWVTVAFTLLLIGGFLGLKYMMR